MKLPDRITFHIFHILIKAAQAKSLRSTLGMLLKRGIANATSLKAATKPGQELHGF